jgi:hypothetical protein
MLCACELLHVACRDERLGADAGSKEIYGLFPPKRNYSLSFPLQLPCAWLLALTCTTSAKMRFCGAAGDVGAPSVAVFQPFTSVAVIPPFISGNACLSII